MEATIWWTEGKPWEIAWGELRWEGARWKLGESCVGKERDGSDGRVDGGKTVGNRLCQNVQKAPCSEHVWKLRCRKSARSCGEKHVSSSKCTKHAMLGRLLEVEMSKKCTPLWREARFQVKMHKAHHARSTVGS